MSLHPSHILALLNSNKQYIALLNQLQSLHHSPDHTPMLLNYSPDHIPMLLNFSPDHIPISLNYSPGRRRLRFQRFPAARARVN